MKQFILNTEPDSGGFIRFTGSDYRYLARVRRLAPGEFFPAVLPVGTPVLVRVCSVDKQQLVGKITEPETAAESSGAASPLPPIILFQALPKGEKMNLIVRQAAEGGLSEIVPFVSEFSSVQTGKTGGQKFSRWERIIKEARQQSGSPAATAIRPPLLMDEALAYWNQIQTQQIGVLGLLFHHIPLANEGLHRYLGKTPSAVVLAVGPEGGFSPAEAERFLTAGFKPCTVGDTILRTETAALYAQAAVRVLLLEKDSWATN